MKHLSILTAAVILVVIGIVTIPRRSELRTEPEVAFRSGLEAAGNNDWRTVALCIRQLNSCSGFRPHQQLLLGLSQVAEGRTERGLSNLAAAGSDPATRVAAFTAAGRTYYGLKQYAEAIRILNQVLVWSPDAEEACRYLASAYYDVGAMEDALRVLEQVAGMAPQDFRAYRFRGLILKDFERFSEAVEQFRQASERLPSGSPERLELHRDWADCLVRERRFEEALEVLPAPGEADSAAAELRGDILALRAAACLNLRRFDEARDAADQALTLAPQNSGAALTAARISEESGDFASALTRLQTAVAASPAEPQLHGRLADLFLQLGRHQEAQVHREESTRLIETRIQFSDLHQQAISQPEDVGVRLRLADVAQELDRPDLARMWLEAAAGLAPGNAEVRQARSRFEQDFPKH